MTEVGVMRSRSARRMTWIAVAAIVTMLVHDADHLRQAVDMDYDPAVHVVAILLSAYIPLGLSIWWARRGRITASAVAASTVLVGVLVLLSTVHLVGVEQMWSPLGDLFGIWGSSYRDMHIDAFSWAAFVLLFLGYAYLFGQVLDVLREEKAPHQANGLR